MLFAKCVTCTGTRPRQEVSYPETRIKEICGKISTRGRGKVLEQTGGKMSVRGTRQRAVIFLLGYLEI